MLVLLIQALANFTENDFFHFLPSSGGKFGSKLDQKCNIWVYPVVLTF